MVVTTNNYNTVKITGITAHEIKSSISAFIGRCYVTDLNNGYAFTIFSLSVSWQRNLTQELYQSHFRYHCTTAHIKSSNHTRSFHRLIYNSASTILLRLLNYQFHVSNAIILTLTAPSSNFLSQLSNLLGRVRVSLWLKVYGQSVRLGNKPLETHGQYFFLSTEHLRS
jgi:hypothetical protein